MNSKHKIKEEYILSIIVVILATTAVFGILKICLPNFKLYRSLSREVKEKDKELNIRKTTIVQIKKLKQDIDQIDKNYTNFTQKIIMQPGTFEAVKVITDIAKGLKIEFVSIQPSALLKLELSSHNDGGFSKFLQEEGKEFFLWEIPVSIKIKGDFGNILGFIKRLEEGERFIKIKQFHIKKDPSLPLAHDADISISMFSLPETDKIEKIKENE